MYISEKDFKPRLTKPESGNPYYNRTPKGYSNCIKGNPLDKGCNVLANCVGYVTGRMNEETNEGKMLFLGSMNACSIYDYCKKHGLETGTIPRVGAIGCYKGGSDKLGHVFAVEKVYNDNEILKSESQHNYFVFKTKKVKKGNGNWGMSDSYKFQSFVYNPHIIKIAEPVERDYTKDQLEVIKNKLRIRVSPSLTADILGIAELGYYNDLDTIGGDGYTWHKIADNNWMAEVDGYVTLLPKLNVGDIVKIKEPIQKYKITNIEDNEASIIPITDLNNLERLG